MAFTLSRYLRLRLDSNLTANARYNLERIDLLGSTLSIDNTSSVNFRSRTDINMEPQSQIAGGSGVGGVVNIGSSGHEITSFNVFASEVNFSDPDAVVGALLPDQSGNAGKVLSTDGAALSWISVAGGSSVQSAETDWLNAAGTSKVFTHSLGTEDVIVSVIDIDTDEIIGIDSVVVTGPNSITLTASESPANSWRVVVHAG